MRMQPWTALWAIKSIPGDGFEVIRDGRHVGIARCGDFEEAVKEIVEHPLYQDWDRVVCRCGRRQWDVDVVASSRELVGA